MNENKKEFEQSLSKLTQEQRAVILKEILLLQKQKQQKLSG